MNLKLNLLLIIISNIVSVKTHVKTDTLYINLKSEAKHSVNYMNRGQDTLMSIGIENKKWRWFSVNINNLYFTGFKKFGDNVTLKQFVSPKSLNKKKVLTVNQFIDSLNKKGFFNGLTNRTLLLVEPTGRNKDILYNMKFPNPDPVE